MNPDHKDEEARGKGNREGRDWCPPPWFDADVSAELPPPRVSRPAPLALLAPADREK